MSNILARGVKFQDVKHEIGIVIEVLNKKKGEDVLKMRKKYEMNSVKKKKVFFKRCFLFLKKLFFLKN